MRIQSTDGGAYLDIGLVTESGLPLLQVVARFGDFHGKRDGIVESHISAYNVFSELSLQALFARAMSEHTSLEMES